MRCAVLDLGSNSFHLLVADVEGSVVVPVRRQREMLHLGRAIARHGTIPTELQERAIATVERLSELALRSGAEALIAVGTEALRGTDTSAFVDRLTGAAGTTLTILDGAEEARLAYLGARASVDVADEPTLVIDLGGGSLELAVGSDERIAWATSLPLGASRLTAMLDPDADPKETTKDDGPIPLVALQRLQAHVDELLSGAAADLRTNAPRTVLAVGGTVRALARLLAVRSARWLPATVNQAPLDAGELSEAASALMAVGTAERARMPGVKSRRADHLHVAALVLEATLRRSSTGHWHASATGGCARGSCSSTSDTSACASGPALRAQQVTWLRSARSTAMTPTRTMSRLSAASCSTRPSAPRPRADAHASSSVTPHGSTPSDPPSRCDVNRSTAPTSSSTRSSAASTPTSSRCCSPSSASIPHAGSRVVSRPSRPCLKTQREVTNDLLALLQVADALDASHDQHTPRSHRHQEATAAGSRSSSPTGRTRSRSVQFGTAPGCSPERFSLPLPLAPGGSA
jgi:exopolyphosphatase / guanosine-5'-triphosphate,3'-diphosphate pyrophosphatase